MCLHVVPPLFSATTQDLHIAAAAVQFMRALAPALFLDAADQCCRRYLGAQSVVKPALWITALTTLLTPVYLHLFCSRWVLPNVLAQASGVATLHASAHKRFFRFPAVLLGRVQLAGRVSTLASVVIPNTSRPPTCVQNGWGLAWSCLCLGRSPSYKPTDDGGLLLSTHTSRESVQVRTLGRLRAVQQRKMQSSVRHSSRDTSRH
jgi:hypothetical protein